MPHSTEHHVGNADVDSGTIWLGDPYYLVGMALNGTELFEKIQTTRFFEDHDGYCEPIGPGMGLTVDSGGDGSYPVYVKYNSEGRVAEVRVVFLDSDGNHPYDDSWHGSDDDVWESQR